MTTLQMHTVHTYTVSMTRTDYEVQAQTYEEAEKRITSPESCIPVEATAQRVVSHYTTPESQMASYFFTFGPDQHTVPNAYVIIRGPRLSGSVARDMMHALYGPEWSMMYDEQEFAERGMPDKYEMRRVRVVEVQDDLASRRRPR